MSGNAQTNPFQDIFHFVENWKYVGKIAASLRHWTFGSHAGLEGRSAVAILGGESGVNGVVRFLKKSDDSIAVHGEIHGLAKGKHGLHVHEYGDSTSGCVSAGPHFNPFNKTHGSPKDDNRHMGDLGNVEANDSGVAKFNFIDQCIRLSGPHSIVGRSLVIHANEDDLGRGTDDKREESLKTGNAGARVACGVIGHSTS